MTIATMIIMFIKASPIEQNSISNENTTTTTLKSKKRKTMVAECLNNLFFFSSLTVFYSHIVLQILKMTKLLIPIVNREQNRHIASKFIFASFILVYSRPFFTKSREKLWSTKPVTGS